MRTAVPRRERGIRVLRSLIAVFALLAPWVAAAHPHAYIDLRSAVVLDDAGQVTGIEQEWQFDPFYSALLGAGRSTTTMTPREQAQGILERLHNHGYFTEVRVGERVVSPRRAKDIDGGIRAGRYWIRFVLPLQQPLDAARETLTFSVFDPTYYIEILHLENDVVSFHGAGADRCLGDIQPPKPTTEDIIRARSPAVDAQSDSSLGALFAERVEVRCQ